jgi:hypothetical protein
MGSCVAAAFSFSFVRRSLMMRVGFAPCRSSLLMKAMRGTL